jgi:hypothetical protein
MTRQYELRAYDYVNHDYASVREALLADPLAIFRDATASGAGKAATSELHVDVGAVELSADIDITLGSIWPSRSPLGKAAQAISLAWSSPRRPGWFPTMRATLVIYALSPTETQLDFDGEYEPPMGVFGAAADTMVMHRFAEAAAQNFVRDVAGHLRTEIGRKPAIAAHSAR